MYFSVHHWCGLLVGLFLLLMSVTGATLVFTDELNHHDIKPFLAVDNPAGEVHIDASFKNIQQQYPGWELRIYEWPKANEALVYELRKKEDRMRVFVHPVNGAITHVVKDANNSLQRRLLLLHYTLFSGTPGKIIICSVSVVFFLSLLSGLFLYRRSILKVLSFKTKIHSQTARAFFSSLHRVIGVWSLVWNLLIVVTGFSLSYNIVMNAVKPAAKKTVAAKKAESVASLDSIINRVRASYPELDVHMIRLPANASTVIVRGSMQTDPSFSGEYANTLQYNGQSFMLEKKQWFTSAAFADKWTSAIGPLHFGNYGGILLKLFYALMGLIPGLLSVSGFVIWRYRKRKTHSVS